MQLAREDGFGCLFCFGSSEEDEIRIGIGIGAAVGEWGWHC